MATHASSTGWSEGDEAFAVHYSLPFTYLKSQAWKIVVSMAAVAVIVVLLDPYGDKDIIRRGGQGDWTTQWVILLSIVAIGLAIDFGMMAKRVMSGMPALLVDEAGLIGYWGGWPCEIAHDDVDQVQEAGGFLTIYSKQLGFFGRLFGSHVSPHNAGSRYDHRARITVPLAYVDTGAWDIRRAISHG